jgi:oxygen-independent coproporphyrinogen-3 oxidase
VIPPPLGLYVHIPWCLRKCPYCDFNSHAVAGELPESAYVDALLADLARQAPQVADRPVQTVFFGGGTPSLFSGAAIARLLEGIAATVALAPDAEITLEANPGAAEAARFSDYRAAGVNRLSIGVQSLDDACLRALGRVHNADQARQAVEQARAAGFDNLNLDLMYGLPGQNMDGALADLRAVLALSPEHLSWYQLTLEPNTLFHARPPALPDADTVADIMEAGLALLAGAGYHQYEVSAHARPGRAARHNCNYWTFGDYLGIGAGAHGKLSTPDGRVRRYSRPRHPRDYLAAPTAPGSERILSVDDLPLEFLMNALRLHSGVSASLFRERTGLSLAVIEAPLAQARARGLLEDDPAVLRPTALGRHFLDDLLLLFEVSA